ncbi:hypothetical protein PS865_02678 [Pseudomonas fluorescens]|nr:hypothetical protein PS865_02678 [Pseudomonas fluorescens]
MLSCVPTSFLSTVSTQTFCPVPQKTVNLSPIAMFPHGPAWHRSPLSGKLPRAAAMLMPHTSGSVDTGSLLPPGMTSFASSRGLLGPDMALTPCGKGRSELTRVAGIAHLSKLTGAQWYPTSGCRREPARSHAWNAVKLWQRA